MTRVVIINGFPGSGKDEFVRFCKDCYPNTLNVHTSDLAKQVLASLGWNGDKTPEARKLLADMIELSYKYEGVQQFIQAMYEAAPDDSVMFVHCREFENVMYFKDKYPGALTLFIDRAICDPINVNYSNESDILADMYKNTYDYIVYNNGTLATLKYSAQAFMVVATSEVKR